jgi:dTDP-4-dehydrorhamnose reductase
MTGRRVAITGSGGQLGRELVRAFQAAGDDVLGLVRPEFDLTRGGDLERLTAWRPEVVVNSAAWTDVDGCARDPDRAMRINGVAAGAVASSAAAAGALAVQMSTNEVFEGSLDRPYLESDPPGPINPYGASKLAGEQLVAEAAPQHLIVRTAWLFGPGGTNFVTKILGAAERARAAGEPLRVVADEWGNPTPTPWLGESVVGLVDLAVRANIDLPRTWHVAGQPPASRFDWAGWVVRDMGVRLEPMALANYRRDSVVPPRAVLDTRWVDLLSLPDADWRSWSDRVAGRV